MIKNIFFAGMVLLALTSQAQTVDLRRKIEVSGTAETEVTPDIIYFAISLKEYMDGHNRVTIDVLESQLQKAVNDAGIPKEDFTIGSVSGYTNYYQKRRDPNFLASKQYRLKLHDLFKINQILAGLDPKGTESTYIESNEYSKITELKRQLKLQALLAAKDKATFLLNGIGEKLGSAIEITEDADNNIYRPSPMSNVMFKSVNGGANDGTQDDINYKKIKLTFTIRAVFEIAN